MDGKRDQTQGTGLYCDCGKEVDYHELTAGGLTSSYVVCTKCKPKGTRRVPPRSTPRSRCYQNLKGNWISLAKKEVRYQVYRRSRELLPNQSQPYSLLFVPGPHPAEEIAIQKEILRGQFRSVAVDMNARCVARALNHDADMGLVGNVNAIDGYALPELGLDLLDMANLDCFGLLTERALSTMMLVGGITLHVLVVSLIYGRETGVVRRRLLANSKRREVRQFADLFPARRRLAADRVYLVQSDLRPAGWSLDTCLTYVSKRPIVVMLFTREERATPNIMAITDNSLRERLVREAPAKGVGRYAKRMERLYHLPPGAATEWFRK